ncbi:MAG: peptidase [Bacteroidota bacterium]
MLDKILLLLLSISVLSPAPFVSDESRTTRYTVDLTQKVDTILVRVEVAGNLARDEGAFQFPATAPGTYQTMNIGRYVANFKAFDKKGKTLKVSYDEPNRYIISKPHKLDHLQYEVAETFDTRLKKWPIYLMCGTSLEADHAFINPHAIAGFFSSLQGEPVAIQFEHHASWKTGTALSMSNGWYQADDYDHLVDSPFLMGHLTFEDTTIASTDIRIYAYSSEQRVKADLLMQDMSDMLDASRKFLIDLPVERYTFLFFFEPSLAGTTGAWEHSYSSAYVLNEGNPTPRFLQRVTDIASHEFFHIVTPLNIHSEVIEQFNFETPTPSKHLWLYEGVTEWASNILLFRAEQVDLDTYLRKAVAQKIQVNELYFDKSWSLGKISEESYSEAGARQFGNIYHRGSIVAGLLDILLLDLSDGRRGLRELILDLAEEYGPGKPVPEDAFDQIITQRTFPEVQGFFDDYIWGSKPLPYQTYFDKIGIAYSTHGKRVSLRKRRKLSERQQMLFDAWSRNLER